MKKYVYYHINRVEKLVYAGQTNNPNRRFQPSNYTGSKNFYKAIQTFGWNSFEHHILPFEYDENEAIKLEGALINSFSDSGYTTLNIHQSGFATQDPDYYKKYEAKETTKQTRKRYCESENRKKTLYNYNHSEKGRLSRLKYKHSEKAKENNRKPENLIYTRVNDFNRYHPDSIVETPLEAKKKYLLTGYIPSYIKSSDLI